MNSVLPQVIDAVRRAADMLVAEARRPGGPRGGGSKADIDTEIEHVLREALSPLLHAGFAGEETGTTPAPPDTEFLWLVDPHDGTGEFLRGYRGSSISVALLRAGEPVLGVVCAPLSPDRGFDLIAWAQGGALTRNGQAISVNLSDRALESDGYVFLNPRAARIAKLNAALVAPARFIGMPSIAYRLARVAAGDGLATMSLHGLHAWDFAGGHALLKAAGGTVVDERGRAVSYDPRTGKSVLKRCFGGAPAAVSALAVRDWDRIEGAVNAPLRLQLRWPRPVDAGRLDRAFGCLVGHAAGAQSTERNGLNAPIGFQSDPMELAVAFARSLVRAGGYDAVDAVETYRRWLRSRAEGHEVEPATGGSGGQPANTAPPAPVKEAFDPLTQLAPLGILCEGEPMRAARLARDEARLSGAATLCSEAAAVYAGFVAVLVARGSAVDAPALRELAASLVTPQSPEGGALLALLSGATGDRPQPDMPLRTSPVLNGLCAAVLVLSSPEHLQPERLRVVFASLAGERSTTNSIQDANGGAREAAAAAAVAGALLGARHGAQSMPAWSLAAQASRGISNGSARARPDEYWPDDLPVLADALLAISGEE